MSNGMSEQEEKLQRALGTLPKFEVNVERDVLRKSYVRVLVAASDADAANKRALDIVEGDGKDDTGSKISWAVNTDDADAAPATVAETRELAADDYLIHRFDRKSNDDDDEKTDAGFLGKVM